MSNFLEKTYEDEKGYLRFKDTEKLVHRWKAKKEIYEKDRKKYPLAFEDYQVHHIDGNKRNNRIENLRLVTKFEHESLHGYERFEWIIIRSLVIFIFLIIAVLWLSNIARWNNWSMTYFFISFILLLLIAYIVIIYLNREKKGKKYIY